MGLSQLDYNWLPTALKHCDRKFHNSYVLSLPLHDAPPSHIFYLEETDILFCCAWCLYIVYNCLTPRILSTDLSPSTRLYSFMWVWFVSRVELYCLTYNAIFFWRTLGCICTLTPRADEGSLHVSGSRKKNGESVSGQCLTWHGHTNMRSECFANPPEKHKIMYNNLQSFQLKVDLKNRQDLSSS